MTDTLTAAPTIELPKIAPSTSPAPRKKTELRREYVAGTRNGTYTAMVRALPQAIDDLQADLGDDIYERMERDPAVKAPVKTVKTGILAHSWRLIPFPVTVPDAPPEDPKAKPPTRRATAAARKAAKAALAQKELADQIAAFCQAVLERIDPSLDDVLWNWLDAVPLGHKLAELVYEYREMDGVTRLVLKAIKVKPRGTYAFVVDPYMNVVGILGRLPNSGLPTTASLISTEPGKQPENLLPREKFAVLTYEMKDGDPRGQAALRPAYNAWWIKTQTWPEWLKFIAQFATPSVSAVAAPDPDGYTPRYNEAGEEVDEEGNPIPSRVQELLDMLVAWQNGSAMAAPPGTVITVHSNGENTGEAFDRLYDRCDEYITQAILLQLLATGTSEHQTNASSRTHQDVLNDVISTIKGWLARTFRREVLEKLVRYNFGEAAVALTPTLDLGAVEQQDLTPLMEAIAKLQTSNYLTPSQKRAIDALLNLPVRTIEETAQEQQRAAAAPVAPGGEPAGDQGDDEQTSEPADDADEEDTDDARV